MTTPAGIEDFQKKYVTYKVLFHSILGTQSENNEGSHLTCEY